MYLHVGSISLFHSLGWRLVLNLQHDLYLSRILVFSTIPINSYHKCDTGFHGGNKHSANQNKRPFLYRDFCPQLGLVSLAACPSLTHHHVPTTTSVNSRRHGNQDDVCLFETAYLGIACRASSFLFIAPFLSWLHHGGPFATFE